MHGVVKKRAGCVRVGVLESGAPDVFRAPTAKVTRRFAPPSAQRDGKSEANGAWKSASGPQSRLNAAKIICGG